MQAHSTWQLTIHLYYISIHLNLNLLSDSHLLVNRPLGTTGCMMTTRLECHDMQNMYSYIHYIPGRVILRKAVNEKSGMK